MKINKNVDSKYKEPLKKLDKIKSLEIESYNNDKIQEMIDLLNQFSNLNIQERRDELKQMIAKLLEIENHQKNISLKLKEDNNLIKQSELKYRLKKIKKIILKLDDVVEIMYDLVRKENEIIAKLNQF